MAAKSFGASKSDLRPTTVQDRPTFDGFFCPISSKHVFKLKTWTNIKEIGKNLSIYL